MKRVMAKGWREFHVRPMDGLFRLLGILLALYVALSLERGVVYAKSGPWGRSYRRDEHSYHYWSAIVCYVLLSLALIFLF